MNRFAALIDRLATADDAMRPHLLANYLATTPEPDRTLATDILAGKLKPRRVKLALVRGLAQTRLDQALFELSLDYVGDMAETIALLWPKQTRANRDPSLSEVIDALATLGRSELPKRIETWLDACDVDGRWALIKLITGTLVGKPKQPPSNTSQNEMFETASQTPGTVAAVVLYIEMGRTKATPTSCTFGLWHEGTLVPIGKAALSVSEDHERLKAFVRDNTANRYGPVREVTPTLVLDIAFNGVQREPRRKSGLALRDARIVGIRWNAQPSDANLLESLENLLPPR